MQDQNDNGTIDWIDAELANEFKALEQHEAETVTPQEMEAARPTLCPTMSSLIDTTEGLELWQVANYVYDLKRALLCNEALDDIDDYGATEAQCHFYTALSNLEIAANAFRLADVSLNKAKRN